MRPLTEEPFMNDQTQVSAGVVRAPACLHCNHGRQGTFGQLWRIEL